MKALSLFGCLLLLVACKAKTDDNNEEMAKRSSKPEAVVVETVTAINGVFYHELISNGKVFAGQKVVVPCKAVGTIVELRVSNGQRVKAGELLASVEDFNYRTALTRAQNRYDKAMVDYTIDRLTVNKSGDSLDISPDKDKMMKYRSGLTEAELAIAEAQYNLNNTRIVAPISGRVANLEARLHNQSGPVFCTIISDDLMEVEFPVIESEYKFVNLGMPVGIVPFANDSISLMGNISEINPIVAANGMITVKASFKNSAGLLEGMNVKILIRKPEQNRIVVPKEALVMRQGRDVIFVREDSLAIWRYVTIEFENSTSLAIKEGLSAGDKIIIKGNVNLSHETVVKENAN